MNTPTKPIHEIVKDSVRSIVNEFPTGNEYESGYKDGYQMGYSVAGNDYGLKWEQAKKALEDAVAAHEADKAKLLSKYPQLEGKLDPAVLPWVNNAKALLATWKEEGKPENKTF